MRKSQLCMMVCLFLILVGCKQTEDVKHEDSNRDSETNELEKIEEDPVEQVDAEPVELKISEYGEEIGFTMEEPPSEVATTFSLNGVIEEADELAGDYVLVEVRKTERIEEINSQEIAYYVALEDGKFSKEINLPNGAGYYRVTVRVPSKDRENYLYDTSTFNITNVDEAIARDVEYTKYGLKKSLQMADSVKGWNQASRKIEVEGTVSDSYEDLSLLAKVERDGSESTIVIPIENGAFKGEIPLYYGQGTHEITMQLYSDDPKDRDWYYYDAAHFFVHNDSTEYLSEVTQSGLYVESGLMLEQPSPAMEMEQQTIDYPVKGRINPDAPLADSVSHVVVEMKQLDDKDNIATYYFPVIDGSFEGMAHFRFGSGDYQVTIFIPNEEQKRKDEFHYTLAHRIMHTVTDIEDERDLLPSRGVESTDATIIDQAKEITVGLTTEREKAKAIYEFVAKHVAYDVDKFKQDIFHPNDSALATLSSGSGICQDYTFLTVALLRSVDIESRYVNGFAGGRHSWVEANVDGEWIEMDPTWGAGYIKRDVFHFKYNEEYFDPDPAFLAETHVRRGLLY